MHPGTAGRLSRQFRKAIAFDIWRLSARARSDIKAIYIYTYILVSFKGYPRTNLKRGSSLAEKRIPGLLEKEYHALPERAGPIYSIYSINYIFNISNVFSTPPILNIQ